jgi:hypothetical protein
MQIDPDELAGELSALGERPLNRRGANAAASSSGSVNLRTTLEGITRLDALG